MMPWSNDPAALMRTVGEVSGAVGAISLIMIFFGLIGRKHRPDKASFRKAGRRRSGDDFSTVFAGFGGPRQNG